MKILLLIIITCLSGFQFRLIFRVQTLALGAKIEVVSFGGATAVSTIPTTAAVIISVITNLISFPNIFLASLAACHAFGLWIFATAV